MQALLPLPVLHIRRIAAEIYSWGLVQSNQIVEQEDGLSSIQECLCRAYPNLPEEGGGIEIRYRSIGLGTFPAQALEDDPKLIADMLVERYSEVMDKLR